VSWLLLDYSYKGFHGLVLMGIFNANYEFTYISYGTGGRTSDGGVIACKVGPANQRGCIIRCVGNLADEMF
jgi:hypothetical protein